jgi:hypothetical protein
MRLAYAPIGLLVIISAPLALIAGLSPTRLIGRYAGAAAVAAAAAPT